MITTGEDTATEADVLRHFMGKFQWLAGAETRPVRDFLDRVFRSF